MIKPTRPYVFDTIQPRTHSAKKAARGRQIAQLGLETVEFLDSLDDLHERHVLDEILPRENYEDRDDMGM